MSTPSAALVLETSPSGSRPLALRRIQAIFLAERDRWILWLPVLVGAGIAIYFALPAEPPPWAGITLAAMAGMFCALALLSSGERYPGVRLLAVAVVAVVAGFVSAQLKTVMLATPMLSEPIGPTLVSGRVQQVETFPVGQRVTLDRLTISRLDGQPVPKSIRLRLRGAQPPIRPGDQVRIRAMLMPPSPPAVPGGYDFQRHAYFEGLGAVGYSIGTATVLSQRNTHSNNTFALWFANVRLTVIERVRAHIDGAAAAVTIALLTGERRAVPEPVMAAIRDSGLAHLLSISGLHIGLVAGIVFVTLRGGLALIPFVALRYPIKKWAAVVSVLAAGAYTLLADAPVPSQRAFLMVAIVLLAVLVDRQGLSMRLVSFAALVILLTQPQTLLGPSFQMSFAAVVALIAAYEAIRERRYVVGERPSVGGLVLFYGAGVILTTLVASAATTPYAAFHFNRFQVYGVAANLVAVPVTSFWIMPWAVVAMLLMPFGLEEVGLLPMSWGVDVVIWIARAVAAWPGAVVLLPPMPMWGLAVITLGGLWLCLWRRSWRLFGLAAIAIGATAMLSGRVPDLFVDGGGRLMAVRGTGGGLVLSSAKAARSTREAWLRRAGTDEAAGYWPEHDASPDAPLRCDSLGCVLRANGHVVAIARRGESLKEDCDLADVVVSLVPARGHCRPAGMRVDRFDLWRNGTHVLWLGDGGVRVESVNGERGARPWVIRPPASDEDDEADGGDSRDSQFDRRRGGDDQ
jgi:competence protein ComEC